MNFDEYSNRLQEIVKKLEKNDISVEEGTKLYEEGVEIAKRCFAILNDSKGKITILKDELDKLSNFDDEWFVSTLHSTMTIFGNKFNVKLY